MQKRKSWILLTVFIFLAGIYFLFVRPLSSNSLNEREISFAVEDTASITKIVLTRVAEGKNVQQLMLTRQSPNSWQLNGLYPAFQPRMNTLLETVHLIHVREVLAKAGIEAGKELLDFKHTLVEIYANKKKIKSYKVGTEGKGGKGTLMMLESARNPYMVEIPGLQGYLNSRYSMEQGVWRENLLFNAHLKNIKSVSIQYTDLKKNSFILSRENIESPWQIDDVDAPLDDLALKTYLAHFNGKVYAETFANSRYPGKIETLKSSEPTIRLAIDYFSKEKRRINLFERPENPNNYFGWVNESNELLTIQHFVIDKFLIDRDYLINIDS